MNTDKPSFQVGAWIANLKQIIRYNAKEFKTWLGDVLIRQDREVIERSAGTFRWHLKEILLCLLLAFLFAKVDKVQHFFTSFSIDIKERRYTIWEFLWAFCTNGVVVIWLSYVFWHKPKRVRGWISGIFGDRRDRTYDVQYKLPNGFWWVAVVSSLPVLLVNTALSISLLKDYNYQPSPEETSVSKFITDNTTSIFLLVTCLYALICIYIKPRLRENAALRYLKAKFKIYLGLFGLFLLLFILLFYYCIGAQSEGISLYKTLLFRYVILTGFVFSLPILLTHIWYAASRCLQKEAQQADADNTKEKAKDSELDRIFDAFRYASYFVSICFFLMLNLKYFTTTEQFSHIAGPVAVLLFVFIFYYQLWDFITHNVTRIRRNAAFVLLMLAIILAARNEHFQLKFNGVTPATVLERTDLETFFLKWAFDRYTKDGWAPQDSATFYLVAAEGGGSRSGAWTSSVLTELDARTQGRFRRNCFAISSVSGGTVGSAVTLSLWDNILRDPKLQTMVSDSIYKPYSEKQGRANRTDARYIQRVFGRNYVSTAIAGIFFYDFWQSVPLINLLYASDYSRTDRHQDEENDAVYKALSEMLVAKENNFQRYYKHTSFLSLYYNQSANERAPRPRVELPLFFPNTTRVEDGRRGILSPVLMPSSDTTNQYNPFIASVDVIGLAGKENPYRSFSLSEAAGMSQLFPFVNSNVKVSDHVGRYMDGGAYENMGLTTLYEIRKHLSDICKDQCNSKDPVFLKRTFAESDSMLAAFNGFLSRIQFKIILIYNIDNHANEDNLEKNAARQWLDPITALLKTPFSGHTDHIYHKVKKELNREIVEFALIERNNTAEYHQDIVMSRWLSKYEMAKILERSEELVTQKLPQLEAKRKK